MQRKPNLDNWSWILEFGFWNLEFGIVIEVEPALGIEVESPQRCGAIAEQREDL